MVRRLPLVRIVSACFLALVCVMSSVAQSSDHQRIGVERKNAWELGIEAGCGGRHESYGGIDYFLGDSYLSIDLLADRAWTASLYLPLSSRFIIGDGIQRTVAVAFGDFRLSAGWTGRIDDTRVSASLNVTLPTGQWSDYASAEGVLAPGSGRWSVGTALSASMILDPVVLGAAFIYDLGLPRAERYSTTWRPGDMSLSLSVTEVLNDRVGYSLKAVQSVSLPELSEGAYSLDSFSYGALASIEFWYSDGDAAARFGISKSVTIPEEPARLYAALSYALRSEKEDA